MLDCLLNGVEAVPEDALLGASMGQHLDLDLLSSLLTRLTTPDQRKVENHQQHGKSFGVHQMRVLEVETSAFQRLVQALCPPTSGVLGQRGGGVTACRRELTTPQNVA